MNILFELKAVRMFGEPSANYLGLLLKMLKLFGLLFGHEVTRVSGNVL